MEFGEPRPDVDEAATMQPRHAVAMRLDRDRGLQSFSVSICVTCAEQTHNARAEMVDLLRTTALEIETGVA